uniref:C-type lectin n=1 Tax=Meretrix meretrix TaxID=291251 RepID=S4UCQ4_MERMT|nr:C-type lectin [Meretrix meretrix]
MADSGRSNEDGKNRGQCQQGFVTYDNWNSCYMFSTFNTTWYDARDYCVAMGGDLVSLGSLQEHFLVAFHILNDPEYSAAQGWWTSGTFVVKTKQWMWMSNIDIQPVTYVKWAVNEPNDQHDKNLQCLMMYRLDDMLWHDRICTDRYNFVCEIPVA